MAKKEFNKAEVLERYRNGEKVTAIAEAMGVSKTEVYTAIRELKRAEEWGGIKPSASGAAFVPSTVTVPGAEPKPRVPKSSVTASDDSVSGTDKEVTAPEEKKPAEGVAGAETAEKPVPKKRGRKKKAEESKSDTTEIKAEAMEGVSHEDKSDADIEAIADTPEEWVEWKIEEDKSKRYYVILKNGHELYISGVTEVIDGWMTVMFKGASGKTVVISAAELMYYYESGCQNRWKGDFSVE